MALSDFSGFPDALKGAKVVIFVSLSDISFYREKFWQVWHGGCRHRGRLNRASEARFPLQRPPGDERRLGPARADATVVGARGRDGFHMAIPSTSEVVQQSTSATEKNFWYVFLHMCVSSVVIIYTQDLEASYECDVNVKLCNESTDFLVRAIFQIIAKIWT